MLLPKLKTLRNFLFLGCEYGKLTALGYLLCLQLVGMTVPEGVTTNKEM